ncbi:uncharacterized protein PAC_01128 [Phialocephala subalpina]|uniref:Uncharacterized protein n=1 Tax=Phialocephala subalpina TaxID=576137 RepID=A0A1L7WEP1_9HELO|nr:uncharacterized protein PAC_01128 [Phialocephala subalpina]
MADTNGSRSTNQESEGTREEIERACQNFLQLLHPKTFSTIEILVNLAAETRLLTEQANHSSTKLELAKEKKDRQTLELKLQEVQRQLQLEEEAHADTEATRAKLAGQLQREVKAHAITEEAKAKLAGQLQQEAKAHVNTEAVRAKLAGQLQLKEEAHTNTEAARAKLAGQLQLKEEAHADTQAAKAELARQLQLKENERVRLENELMEVKGMNGQADADGELTAKINSLLKGDGRFLDGYPQESEAGKTELDENHFLSRDGTVIEKRQNANSQKSKGKGKSGSGPR